MVGSPPPSKITWEKDGQKIVADSRRSIASNGALIITRVIHKRAKNNTDVGEYQCFASSSMGRIASHKVHLDIAGKRQMRNMFLHHFGVSNKFNDVILDVLVSDMDRLVC